MPPARRRLRDLRLTGARRVVHALVAGALAAIGATVAVSFVLEHHRVAGCWDCTDFGEPHRYAAELLGIPIVVPAVVAALAWLTRGRLAPALAAGLANIVAGVALCGMVVSVHFTHATHESLAGGAAILGLLAMIPGGAAAMIAAPLLALAERRHLERDVDPVVATARVVKG